MARGEVCAASARRAGTRALRATFGLLLATFGLLLTAAALCVSVGVGAATASTVTFTPSFSNNGLGEGATFDAAFTFPDTGYHGSAPPLTKLLIHLPSGVGGSPAGFATCERTTLEADGPAGCPTGSIAGPAGAVSFAFELGTETLSETGTAQPLFASPEGKLLFYIQATAPLPIELVTEASYGDDVAPYGRVLTWELPLVESVPGAPYVSITALSIELGASRQEGAATVSSVVVPQECPQGGKFAWAADTTQYEQSAQRTTAETACPGVSGETATTTSLQASSASPVIGETVTYTATVTPSVAGPTEPSGSVEFLDAGSPISGCSAAGLVAGASDATAVCQLSYAVAGSHSITAVFAGDLSFSGSASGPQVVTVQASTPSGGGTPVGGGSNASPSQAPVGGSPQNTAPGGSVKPLTRGQQLAKALARCKRMKPKAKRRLCEASAHRRYGPRPKKRAHGKRHG